MDFLKKIFGGGGGGSSDGGSVLFFYVKPHGCDEIVRIRINKMSELSQNDAQDGYFVYKAVLGTKCFQKAELTLAFDKNRRLTEQTVTGGALVTPAEYDVWQATQAG